MTTFHRATVVLALAAVLVSSGGSLGAQSPLTGQQAARLALAPTFQRRVSVLLDIEGMGILRESGAVLHHTERATLARQILFAPDVYANYLARALVLDTNLIGAGLVLDADGNPVDSGASDGAIRSQIASNWNSWSGVPAP